MRPPCMCTSCVVTATHSRCLFYRTDLYVLSLRTHGGDLRLALFSEHTSSGTVSSKYCIVKNINIVDMKINSPCLQS